MEEDRVLAALYRLEHGQAELQKNMVELQKDVTELRAGQAELRSDQVKLQRQVEGLGREVTDLRVAVMDRFERVQDRLTGIVSDITVNMGAIEHARHRQEHDRDELRSLTKLTFLMQSQIHRLETEVYELRTKGS